MIVAILTPFFLSLKVVEPLALGSTNVSNRTVTVPAVVVLVVVVVGAIVVVLVVVVGAIVVVLVVVVG
jgi:hypothetical protein